MGPLSKPLTKWSASRSHHPSSGLHILCSYRNIGILLALLQAPSHPSLVINLQGIQHRKASNDTITSTNHPSGAQNYSNQSLVLGINYVRSNISDVYYLLNPWFLPVQALIKHSGHAPCHHYKLNWWKKTLLSLKIKFKETDAAKTSKKTLWEEVRKKRESVRARHRT